MELHGVLSLALDDILGGEENAQSFQDSDCTRSIVIRARRGEDRREEEVDAILMSTYDNSGIALPGNRGDNTVLTPGMLEVFCESAMFICACVRDGLLDLLEEPFGRLTTVVGFVVAGVEGSEGLQVRLHVFLLEGFDEGVELFLEGRFGWEGGGFLGAGFEIGAEFLGCGDIHEVLAMLVCVSRVEERLGRRDREAYSTQFPFLLLGHPLCLAWR